ncbi:unnamed protein product [Sphenostylis stenocarpa]|uniref:Uncharacterized protein n=1 Tax=Sphenostylis stenocarpa TaxID=92480 RepID=A0AA86SJJ4_9FABA|nr:unnamed protein product [Sphenostylis stenocarpa]
MARPSRPHSSSDEALSNASSSSEEKERVNEQINEEEDEEELEAVARSASSDDDDDEGAAGNPPDSDEDPAAADDDQVKFAAYFGGDNVDPEISKREKARLKEMQKMKKQKIQEILDAQNAAIDADMNNRGKGRLKYLLQQTELFAHFAKGDQTSPQKSRGSMDSERLTRL